MLGGLQRLLGVGRGRKGEAFAGCDQQARARRVGHADPFAAEVAAVFLRHQIILVQVADLGLKPVQPGAVMLVAIALVRAVAIIGNGVERLRQEQAQAKARQIGHFGVFFAVQYKGQSAVRPDGPDRVQRENPRNIYRRQRHLRLDHRAAVFLGNLYVIHPRDRAVIAHRTPVVLYIAVVVGRRAPDVKAQGTLQQLPAVHGK